MTLYSLLCVVTIVHGISLGGGSSSWGVTASCAHSRAELPLHGLVKTFQMDFWARLYDLRNHSVIYLDMCRVACGWILRVFVLSRAWLEDRESVASKGVRSTAACDFLATNSAQTCDVSLVIIVRRPV